ncbi:DUF3164 family protein [Epibacterium ulvae]|uniref:DUF3164 family protein n=1 Tax=Epibacterium ulvae TaxID=1156985 RepID=UPI00248FD6BE|nr:DUF3164 family protein [Epibacterium ulvae]
MSKQDQIARLAQDIREQHFVFPATSPDEFIRRTDDSFIRIADMSPSAQLSHEIVEKYFFGARVVQEIMRQMKADIIADVQGYNELRMDDEDVAEPGKERRATLRHASLFEAIKVEYGENVTFGPEIDAAKALIHDFLNDELAGTKSTAVRDIVEDAFRLNSDGKLDVNSVRGLRRKFSFTDPRWVRAMELIKEAEDKTRSNTYVNFYLYDAGTNPVSEREHNVHLHMAKV